MPDSSLCFQDKGVKIIFAAGTKAFFAKYRLDI